MEFLPIMINRAGVPVGSEAVGGIPERSRNPVPPSSVRSFPSAGRLALTRTPLSIRGGGDRGGFVPGPEKIPEGSDASS